jgi:putative membrane protein
VSERRGPLILDLTGSAAPPAPEAAPMVLDAPAPEPAMARAVRIAAAAPGGGLAMWFWGLLGSALVLGLSVAAWDWAAGLVAERPILGAVASALLGALVVVALAIAGRELWALARLARIDRLQREAAEARAAGSLARARAVAGGLAALYAGRAELADAAGRLRARLPEVLDADAVLRMAEAELLTPLDARAVREVQAAARQVAVVTAVVPLPLADVAAALAANLRMIRRVAEVYGGRSGAVGALRLVRMVMTHLVATGAVAVGDDLIHGVAGGTVLSRLSRRFGEGVVNGALTARVGIAAVEVCRPLPFLDREGPSVTGILGGALTGLFARGEEPPRQV